MIQITADGMARGGGNGLKIPHRKGHLTGKMWGKSWEINHELSAGACPLPGTRSSGSSYLCQALDFSFVKKERLGEVFFFFFFLSFNMLGFRLFQRMIIFKMLNQDTEW